MRSKKTTLEKTRQQEKGVAITSSDHDLLAQEVLKKFRVVFGSVKKHFQEIEEQCGISGAQVWAVWEISRTPGMRVSELAAALSVHQSTVSNLLDKIEEKGLIRKERTKGDQRVVRLYLTEQGDEMVKLAPQPMTGILPDALRKMPYKTLCNFAKEMDLLISTMALKDESAAIRPLSEL